MMKKKEYLKPTTAVRRTEAEPKWWTPTRPSRGVRQFKFVSKSSQKGFSVIDGFHVNNESAGERNAILVLKARRDTSYVVEQSPQVEYVDEDGVLRIHTFDAHVFRTDGTKVAVDVKPSLLVGKSGIRKLHSLLAVQMKPQVADELLVFTERMYTRDDLFNAELMHVAAKQEYPDDDAAMLSAIRRLAGPISIADLARGSGIDGYGYGFNAVVRAIGAGHLRLAERVRMDDPAIVVPNGRKS